MSKTVREFLMGEKHKVFDGATGNDYVASTKIDGLASRRIDIGIFCDHATKDIKYTIKACYDREHLTESTVILKAETTKLHTDSEPDQEYSVDAWDQIWVEVKNDAADNASSAKVWINEKGA